MSTGNPLLDNLLVAAVFVWIFYWILSLTLKPRKKRIDPERRGKD